MIVLLDEERKERIKACVDEFFKMVDTKCSQGFKKESSLCQVCKVASEKYEVETYKECVEKTEKVYKECFDQTLRKLGIPRNPF